MMRNNLARIMRNEHMNGRSTLPRTVPSSRRQPSRRRRTKPIDVSNSVFKVIVAIEVVFLVTMWKYIPTSILSSPFRRQHQGPSSSSPLDLQLDMKRRRQRTTDRVRSRQEQLESEIDSIKNDLPILVIGGSDGSGTRSFAHAVSNLGVPMKMDLKSNLDITSGEIFRGEGFPPLVNLVLQDLHTVNYEVKDLTDKTRRRALEETRNLRVGVNRWRGGVELSFKREKRSSRATNVSIGFKAPATMLLLPLLKEVFGPIKYIHVVRDGRDVSLSNNQSPVLKFYNSTYSDAQTRRQKYSRGLNGTEPVLAMQLWNDWNTQALQWEQAHATDSDFDFMVMRSEDLINPERKFETMLRLADFVGSPMTKEEICCLSRRDAVDLGQSVRWTGKKKARGGLVRRRERIKPRHLKKESLLEKYGSIRGKEQDHFTWKRKGSLWKYRSSDKDGLSESYLSDLQRRERRQNEKQDETQKEAPKLEQRYGKWREMLKDKPELSAELHQEGADGLATFGYEPHQDRLSGLEKAITMDFPCDDTVICEGDSTSYEEQ